MAYFYLYSIYIVIYYLENLCECRRHCFNSSTFACFKHLCSCMARGTKFADCLVGIRAGFKSDIWGARFQLGASQRFSKQCDCSNCCELRRTADPDCLERHGMALCTEYRRKRVEVGSERIGHCGLVGLCLGCDTSNRFRHGVTQKICLSAYCWRRRRYRFDDC